MWKYHIMSNGRYTTEDELNAVGKDGWELVTVYDGKIYFKRFETEPVYPTPIPPEPVPIPFAPQPPAGTHAVVTRPRPNTETCTGVTGP